MMGSRALFLPTSREVIYFVMKKGNSQCLTVFGWIVLGTAHCKLLQLSTAPPPPVHPEIRVILGHQTVVILCFWKGLVPAEELFPAQSIEGHQLDNSLRLNPAVWVWVHSAQNSQDNAHAFPQAYTCTQECMLDLGISRSGSCLALPWVSGMSLGWARPSSEPQFSHCAVRLFDWISGPHKMRKGNGKTE